MFTLDRDLQIKSLDCLPACLSVCLPIRLSICLPAYLSVYLHACLPVWLPACLPTYLPAWWGRFSPKRLFTQVAILQSGYSLNTHISGAFTERPFHRKGAYSSPSHVPRIFQNGLKYSPFYEESKSGLRFALSLLEPEL
jgi:hypothetical protein